MYTLCAPYYATNREISFIFGGIMRYNATKYTEGDVMSYRSIKVNNGG
jgi:hypothetical protein